MATDIKVKGLDELQKILHELPKNVEANILRGALRAAAKPIAEAAKNNVHRVSGALADSIKISGRISKKTGTVTIKVKAGNYSGSAKVAAGRVVGPYWAHFVEYGTRPHLISVQDDEKKINYRLSRKRGTKVLESMTTINRRVLEIGNNFVGPTVQHPGARPFPFMRPALDAQARNAILAAGEYIKKRLARRHGFETVDIEVGIDDE